MIVGQVCNPYVVTIETGRDVFEAARLMREHHVGDLIVVEEEEAEAKRPVGIITDRDIVVGLVAKDIRDLEKLFVEEVITQDLVTVEETDTVADAVDVMKEHGIRRLPVSDGDDKLVGILTMDDVLALISQEIGGMVEAVQNQMGRERTLRP